MKSTIVKRYSFEAAHQLPNHAGKCANLHGHSYVVEVGVTGPLSTITGSSSEGMVIDFGDVSAAFKERVFGVCDHQYLNDVLPLPLTTAELIAGWILEVMQDALPAVTVSFVRVWETATGYAEARPE